MLLSLTFLLISTLRQEQLQACYITGQFRTILVYAHVRDAVGSTYMQCRLGLFHGLYSFRVNNYFRRWSWRKLYVIIVVFIIVVGNIKIQTKSFIGRIFYSIYVKCFRRCEFGTYIFLYWFICIEQKSFFFNFLSEFWCCSLQ